MKNASRRPRGPFILLALLIVLSAPSLAASRHPARGKLGMVATGEPYATRVGVEILKRGGNAVDAAVATGFALAVTHPSAGNIGGGGYMVIYLAAKGEPVAVDYREKAPAGATKNMYLDGEGNVIPGASTRGYLAVGVPGSVAGLALALEKYGSLPLAEVIAPAIELAEKGFRVSYPFATSLDRSRDILEKFPESRRIFLRNGKPYQEGDRFVQPDLARTLKAIADDGPRGFYEGAVASLIAEDMKAHGGLITREDLRDYEPVLRTPLRGNYRGYEVYSMPPSSSGGTALLELLNIVEAYPLSTYGHNSSSSLHLMIEAMRRTFADRAEFLGDADHVRVPFQGLVSKQYARTLRATIDPFVAGKSSEIGHGRPLGYEEQETTHYSVVDQFGNAVATTTTINGGYGCGATVKGAGFLLNNEMDDFSSKAGSPNMYGLLQGEANAIAAGKRPLSAMTPTIVTKDGKVFLVIGSPGGPTIINTVFQVILNVIDHGMNIQEAIDAPRIHHQWMPDVVRLEESGFSVDVVRALEAKGHQVRVGGLMGDAQGIMIDPGSGIRLGASDPRRFGLALGY